MNKKFTLLAAALMTASTFTANAEGTVDADTSVKAEEWTVGNYYYLKSGDVYLALDGNKPDSVIVKSLADDATKASRRANSEYFSMPATSGIVLVTVEGDATYKVIVK